MTEDTRRKQMIVHLENGQGLIGYAGPGWYFRDPADAFATSGPFGVEGPYETEELAWTEYQAYCEAMTI